MDRTDRDRPWLNSARQKVKAALRLAGKEAAPASLSRVFYSIEDFFADLDAEPAQPEPSRHRHSALWERW